MNDGLLSGTGSNLIVQAGVVSFKKGTREKVFSANSNGRFYVDFNNGTYQNITLNANTTFIFPAPSIGAGFTLLLRQDATGSRTITWPSVPSIIWAGGTAPTITSTANRTDIISFIASPDGTRWWGMVSGMNFA